MNTNEQRKKYKSHFVQLEDDRHLDDQIDEFLLQQKIDEEKSKDLREELNEQEEQYLTYLETKLQETENRIIETQQLVNNRNIKDETEMKQIKELNKRIEKLIESKEEEKSKFLTQGLNEDVKEYIYKLQEENKQLNEERHQFELKYLLRNKQIQILIREIKLYKRNDKYFQDVILNKDKQIQNNTKQLKRLEVGSNDALRRIEFIEQSRQKNIIQLPKIEKQSEALIENDPFNFWRQDIVSDIIQSVTTKQQHQKAQSLKEVIPHSDLWVIEQEKGQKKIDGIDAEKTYAESPETLYQLPHRVQSSRVNDAERQEQLQIPVKPQTSKPQIAGSQSSYNMLSMIDPQYYQEEQQNKMYSGQQYGTVNSYPSKQSIKSNQYYSDPNDITNQYQRYQFNNNNKRY